MPTKPESDFVQSILADNARLRVEHDKLAELKQRELMSLQHDYDRIKYLCAALMGRLNITHVELGSPDWPRHLIGTVMMRYKVESDRHVLIWDMDAEEGTHRLELVERS